MRKDDKEIVVVNAEATRCARPTLQRTEYAHMVVKEAARRRGCPVIIW